jgi:hypothetical protein
VKARLVVSSILVAALVATIPLSPLAQEAGGITVMTEGKQLASGDRYFMPMNAENNTVPLFSEYFLTISIYNKTGAEISLEKIEVARAEGVNEEEITLFTTDMKRTPLAFAGAKLEAGKGNYGFRVRFFPVVSLERAATLTITYGGGQTFELKLAGRGAGSAKFFSHGTEEFFRLIGTPATDEMAGGLVGDAEGNCWFSAQATNLADKFAYDLIYGRVNADGTLGFVKLWNGKFRDYSPDSGQNAETGGTAGSLCLDEEGSLYLAGAYSPASSNNNYAALALKIDAKTGEPLWEKFWRPEWPKSLLAKHSAQFYAVDARGGRVFLTGVTEGDAAVLVLALNAADGSVAFARALDITPGSNDRGYAIRAGEGGSLVIGGLASDRAFLAKLSGADGAEPKVEWVQSLDLGRGSPVNSLDLDAEGNIYASLDRRGAATFFSAAKIAPDGKCLWGKTCQGTAGDRSNTHMVKLIGETLYVGGRLGASGFDTGSGDGLLLALSAADGAEKWTGFHFSGTGPDEACEHRIKGVAACGSGLAVFAQTWTGSRNGERYWGYWYDGVTGLEDYAPVLTPVQVPAENFREIPKGEVKAVADERQILDLKDRLPFMESRGHKGQPSDGDLGFFRLALGH